MIQAELTLGGKDYAIPLPSEWNELKMEELYIISECILQNKPIQLLTLQLIEYRRNLHKINIGAQWYRRVPPQLLSRELLPWAEHLLKENNLTVQPISIRKGHYAPESDFNDLTCGEYEECTALVRQYNADSNKEHLRKIFSVLYRKKNEQNKRIALSASKVPDLKSSFFRRLPLPILHIVYLWYVGCLNSLHRTFAELYEGGESEEDEEGTADLMSFTKLIHAGAGERNGTREQIRAMPIKEYLFDCLLMKQETDRIRQKQDNERKQLH